MGARYIYLDYQWMGETAVTIIDTTPLSTLYALRGTMNKVSTTTTPGQVKRRTHLIYNDPWTGEKTHTSHSKAFMTYGTNRYTTAYSG